MSDALVQCDSVGRLGSEPIKKIDYADCDKSEQSNAHSMSAKPVQSLQFGIQWQGLAGAMALFLFDCNIPLWLFYHCATLPYPSIEEIYHCTVSDTGTL